MPPAAETWRWLLSVRCTVVSYRTTSYTHVLTCRILPSCCCRSAAGLERPKGPLICIVVRYVEAAVVERGWSSIDAACQSVILLLLLVVAIALSMLGRRLLYFRWAEPMHGTAAQRKAAPQSVLLTVVLVCWDCIEHLASPSRATPPSARLQVSGPLIWLASTASRQHQVGRLATTCL